ncbi:hypothetical protein CDAR_249901 [Caerostris darwini]|uniref:Uncharacterized protein n=1 Tax=Caerostris darwini TaxID=1538125 RepID=A0AAV4UTZ0_9ARAC|nr:hypothetical protein CDAR_249901 [Caerostris darwini]
MFQLVPCLNLKPPILTSAALSAEPSSVNSMESSRVTPVTMNFNQGETGRTPPNGNVISAFFWKEWGKAKILSTANPSKSFTRSVSGIFAPIARDNGMRRGTPKEIFSIITKLITPKSPPKALVHSVNESSNYEETCLLNTMNGFRLILHSNLPLGFVTRKKIPLEDVIVILGF